jgi:hypothetical protein
MAQGNDERRTTTSFQLNQGLHRAVQESDASISELAEEGVVHGVVEDLYGLCWLCGSYISKRSGSELVHADDLNTETGTTIFTSPGRWKYDTSDGTSSGTRLNHIAGRMMLPDEVVELCPDCFRLVEEVGFRRPEEFPVAYYGRGRWAFGRQNNQAATRHYAAEVAAVTSASLTDLYEQQPEAAFWWAVHPTVRRKILKNKTIETRPWRCIARHSNAYWWAWGKSAKTVFEMAVNQFPKDPATLGTNRKMGWPGGHNHTSNKNCPACASMDFQGSCPDCLYNKCEQCSHPLTINIQGNIEEKCPNCGWNHYSPQFEEEFIDMYADVFADIRRYIPAERRSDVSRIINS